MKRTRRALRIAVAVALPLALVGGGVLTVPGALPTPQGRAWSGRWLTTTSGSTTGTTLKDVRAIIGADTGTAAGLTGAAATTATPRPD
jgi:serine protease AprX